MFASRLRTGALSHSQAPQKVLVDVSGEPYIDLEMEALAAFKRD
jgi:hypothetical protein